MSDDELSNLTEETIQYVPNQNIAIRISEINYKPNRNNDPIFIYEHLIFQAQNLRTSFEIPKIFIINNPRFSKLKKESGQKLIEKIKYT